MSLEIAQVNFGADGLVPVVAQDAATGDVLMVAWGNRDSVERTQATGEAHYFSRSRNRLWRKGEESGHTQELVSLHADCDGDTLLAVVRQTGPACHTGTPTCFAQKGPIPGGILTRLSATIAARDGADPSTSYTARLLADRGLRTKKLGEETAELIRALLEESPERVADEAADLLYHTLVACHSRGVAASDVLRVLEARHR